jgi:hypothetical protein
VGHSEHYNNFGGFYNTSNHPALKADGSIIAWGRSSRGGTSARHYPSLGLSSFLDTLKRFNPLILKNFKLTLSYI